MEVSIDMLVSLFQYPCASLYTVDDHFLPWNCKNFGQNFGKKYLSILNFEPAVYLTRKYSLIYFAIKHEHIVYRYKNDFIIMSVTYMSVITNHMFERP